MTSGTPLVISATVGRMVLRSLAETAPATAETSGRIDSVWCCTQIREAPSLIKNSMNSRAALGCVAPFMTLDGLLAGYARYNTLIADAAQAEGALLIGGENRIPGDAAHFVDSVHFTDRGSRANADRVVEALAADAKVRELIEQRRR